MPRGKQLDPAILNAALDGLTRRLSDTEAQIAAVKARLRSSGGSAAAASGSAAAPVKRRKTMSASARKRIAAAQRRRWAEFRAKTGGKAS